MLNVNLKVNNLRYFILVLKLAPRYFFISLQVSHYSPTSWVLTLTSPRKSPSFIDIAEALGVVSKTDSPNGLQCNKGLADHPSGRCEELN